MGAIETITVIYTHTRTCKDTHAATADSISIQEAVDQEECIPQHAKLNLRKHRHWDQTYSGLMGTNRSTEQPLIVQSGSVGWAEVCQHTQPIDR